MNGSDNPGSSSGERDDKMADPETDTVAEGGPAADSTGSEGGPGAEVGMSEEPNTFEPEEDPDAQK